MDSIEEIIATFGLLRAQCLLPDPISIGATPETRAACDVAWSWKFGSGMTTIMRIIP